MDQSRLQDKEYLLSLSKQETSVSETTLQEYTEQELEKSDMFLFLKYVNPSAYKAFIRDDVE